MATVILVRHGRTTANATGLLAGRTPGVELDQAGRGQAAATGDRLAVVPLVGVVSSPPPRALPTDRAVLRGLRPADRRRRTHLHLPRELMPAPDLGTDELTLTGRIPTASNATFLGSIGGAAVVYKPIAGEQPLWDFPDGCLAHREVAASRTQAAHGVVGWIGEVLSVEELAGADRVHEGLQGELGSQLAKLLTADEIASLAARPARLRRAGRFPAPSRQMSAVPWPLF